MHMANVVDPACCSNGHPTSFTRVVLSVVVSAVRIPQKIRIIGSLAVIFVVFLLTAVFVKVDVAPLPFFTLTMLKIIFINCEFLKTQLMTNASSSCSHRKEQNAL